MTIAPEVKAALKRVRKGAPLHKENAEGIVRWWFERPYLALEPEIADEVMKRIAKTHELVPKGDGLFGVETSQTWSAVRRQK